MTAFAPSTISMVANSSTDSFARLVAEHQGAVCAVAFSALGDRALSEEIAQEAFLVAWRKLPSLSEPPKLPAWICGIARNLAKNSRRAAAKTEVSDELDDHPALEDGPLDQLLEAESHAIVERALTGLCETYREPLVLFYRQDLSLREVASALQISEANAKQRVSRGRALLTDNVRALVERSLRKSGPGAVFTAGVVAAAAALPREALAAGAKSSLAPKAGSVGGAGLGAAGIAFVALIAVGTIGAGAFFLRNDEPSATTLSVQPTAEASVAREGPKRATPGAKFRPSKKPRRAVTQAKPAPTHAASAPSDRLAAALETKIDLVLNQAKTGEVVRLLSDIAQTPIVVRGEIASDVTVDLKAKTLEQALDQTLEAADAVWEEVELISVVGTPGPRGPALPGPAITVTLKDAPFSEVVSTLGEAMEMPVSLAEGLALPPITLEVRERSAGLVLADVVNGAGLRYEIVQAIEVRADDEAE